LAFKILSGKASKIGYEGRIYCSKEQADIQSWQQCISKSVEKNPL
jgi:hypothetical protein